MVTCVVTRREVSNLPFHQLFESTLYYEERRMKVLLTRRVVSGREEALRSNRNTSPKNKLSSIYRTNNVVTS